MKPGWKKRLAIVGACVLGFFAFHQIAYWATGGEGYVVFSNDGPLGMMVHEDEAMPATVMWDNSQYVGSPSVGLDNGLIALRLIQPQHVPALCYLLPLEFWILVGAYVAGYFCRILNLIMGVNTVCVFVMIAWAFVVGAMYRWPDEMNDYSRDMASIAYLVALFWINPLAFYALGRSESWSESQD
jgi:hypothetical protein